MYHMAKLTSAAASCKRYRQITNGIDAQRNLCLVKATVGYDTNIEGKVV
jgi:hypothetical protein